MILRHFGCRRWSTDTNGIEKREQGPVDYLNAPFPHNKELSSPGCLIARLRKPWANLWGHPLFGGKGAGVGWEGFVC